LTATAVVFSKFAWMSGGAPGGDLRCHSEGYGSPELERVPD
jgi:hypothetical protein